MSWIVDEQVRLVAAGEQRKKEFNESRVQLPEPGKKITVSIRVNEKPLVKVVDGKKRPGTKFSVYQYDTADGKVLECFENLHEKIVEELSKYADKIAADNTEFVFIDIMNAGTATKAAWFVMTRAGV